MIYTEQTKSGVEGAGISIRVAVYPDSGEPEVIEVSAANPRSATAKFSRIISQKVGEMGGRAPEDAVREVVENLIHADYRGVVVSIMDRGNGVRVSDKGQGVEDKSRAMELGFSGATPEAAREIRGVGAGLGIARSAAARLGGTVTLEDNIGGGTVATISVPADDQGARDKEQARQVVPPRRHLDGVPRMNISERQQKALITVLECGEVGPSTVAEQLDISVSTAYRDLSALEENGLVIPEESGKRVISPMGRDLVEAIIGAWVR